MAKNTKEYKIVKYGFGEAIGKLLIITKQIKFLWFEGSKIQI